MIDHDRKAAGESAVEGNARKERILGTLCARMSVVESRGMWLRLSRRREGDPVSEAFARMPSTMRERLLAYLLDEGRLKMIAAKATD